jgi:hypothetical protein
MASLRQAVGVLLLAATVLTAAAWLRGAEYDEQYSLFLTAGTPRPDWPETVFPAAWVQAAQLGDPALADIARDLRRTDVHPPLYFWALAEWRRIAGDGLFAARLLSVVFSLGALALVGCVARAAAIPPALAMLLTLGCYGFTYTGVVARGFALAQLLTLGGVAVLGRAICLPPWLCAHRWLRVRKWGLPRGRRHMMPRGVAHDPPLPPHPEAPRPCRQCHSRPVSAQQEMVPPRTAMTHDGRCIADRSTSWMGDRNHRPVGVSSCNKKRLSENVQPACYAAMTGPLVSLIAGALVGAATLTNYLALFAAMAVVLIPPRHRGWRILGFAIFIPLDLWFFLAQRGSRSGQFPPFALLPDLEVLGRYMAANILGGLPLYAAPGLRPLVAVALGAVFVVLLVLVAWRWGHIGRGQARLALVCAAAAPPAGLLALGLVFDNSPIELRYLGFSTPFAALLLAGALSATPRRSGLRAAAIGILVGIQAASIAGLMLRPETMQPARATARAAAALAGPGIVLLPYGNDGVGIVGAFGIEAPPALPLLLIRPGDTPDTIRHRAAGVSRVVLALLAQDDASRRAIPLMRAAFDHPGWRRAGEGFNVEAYDRIRATE